jgi:uncharacterized membrane protein
MRILLTGKIIQLSFCWLFSTCLHYYRIFVSTMQILAIIVCQRYAFNILKIYDIGCCNIGLFVITLRVLKTIFISYSNRYNKKLMALNIICLLLLYNV